MREKTLFDNILFKAFFGLLLASILALNIYWNWSESAVQVNNHMVDLSVDNQYLSLGIKLLCLAFTLLTIPYLGRSFKLIQRNRQTTFLFLLIFMVCLAVQNFTMNHILAALLIQLWFYFFLRIYNQANIQKLMFYSSIAIALAVFLNLQNTLYLFVLWIGVSIVRSFNLRDLLVSLIAFTLPFIYYYAALFLTDSTIPALTMQWQPKISLDYSVYEIAFLVFMFVSLFHSWTCRNKMIVHQRNQMSFMVSVFLLSFLLSVCYNKQFMLFMALPAAYFVSNMYDSIAKKWILDLIAVLALVSIPLLKFI